MRLLSTLLFSLALCLMAHSQSGALGSWTDHLSYHQVLDMTWDDDVLYAVTGTAMFSYDFSTGELERFSKLSELSDIGAISVALDPLSGVLCIGYSNGNVDLLSESGVVNVPDVKLSNIIGDKSIYEIQVRDGKAWLACGFGVVVLDIARAEVDESFFVAPGGGNLRVESILVTEAEVVIATESGPLQANRSSNLADFANWQPYNDFPPGAVQCDQVGMYQDRILVSTSEGDAAIWQLDQGVWTLVGGTANQLNRGFEIDGDRLLLLNNAYAQLRGPDFTLLETFDASVFGLPAVELRAVAFREGQPWFGDAKEGIISSTLSSAIRPAGPHTNNVWNVGAGPGKMGIAHGAVTTSWDNRFSAEIASSLSEGVWRSWNLPPLTDEDNVRDILDVAFDPFDPNIMYLASYFNGLVRVNLSAGTYTVLNEVNGGAPIEESIFNPGRFQVSSVTFDSFGNLWVNNRNASSLLHVREPGGQWHSYSCSSISSSIAFSQIAVTDDGIAWVALPRGDGMLVYDTKGTLGDTSDDDCRRLSSGVGNGDLPTSTVLSVVKDLDGEIWAGTSEGPAVHFSPAGVFASSPIDFQRILIEQDGNVEVLLGNQTITAIAVDGADRKWLGTQGGGLFLLSPDGTEEIAHFTAADSPLLSDGILSLDIDPLTGEVFIATDQGLVSYRSDATQGTAEATCLDVYPNPVRPGYSGPITFEGMPRDSDVKITDAAGNIVFQMTSNGGRAIWNGQDFGGQQVSTGVYFALVNGPDVEEACVSKVLLVR